jgi:hypothetical protein
MRNTLWIYALKNSNLDIATRHTQWIYVSVQTYEYSIATWTDMVRSRVFISIIPKYESSHVITGVEVEHGRNHLITGH